MTRTRVQGKVVVITGALSGIGRPAAMQFARKGARVVLAARGLASLQDVAVRQRPRRGRHCPRADRIETVYRELDAVEQALDFMGPRDLVVVLADDVEAVVACVRDAGLEH